MMNNSLFAKINAYISSLLLLVYADIAVSLLLFAILNCFLEKNLILPIGIHMVLSVILLITALIMLVYGIIMAIKKRGNFVLGISILTLLFSGIWIIVATMDWLISMNYERIMIWLKGDFHLYNNILLAREGVYTFMAIIVSLFLFITFFISLSKAKNKWIYLQTDLVRPAIALIIAITTLYRVLNIWGIQRYVGNFMGAEEFALSCEIASVIDYGICTMFAFLLAILILVVGLINPKKKTSESEKKLKEKLVSEKTNEKDEISGDEQRGKNS